MCGISGGYWRSQSVTIEQRVAASVASMVHRGPDDSGSWFTQVSLGTVALAQTRLSIIDLTHFGHQPMHSSDSRYTVVFNGEIYNYLELRQELFDLGHRFIGDSDTEVLVAAWSRWGAAGISRLAGMFAFAVYDNMLQTLTLVRDAFGIKPLFYSCDSDSICFGSEMQAVTALSGRRLELNLQSAYNYLTFGRYDSGADTFFEGVQHLLPGHILTVDLTTTEPRTSLSRWWWPSISEDRTQTLEVASEQLRELFLSSVSLHLRSDVAIGAALSGGIDSSAIVCAMRKLQPDLPIHTFSYVARNSRANEEPWIDLVANHVRAVPHKVSLSADMLARDLDEMIRAQGEPFGSTSIYAQFCVYRAARENGVIVTLDGQGADELLAGYNGYPAQRVRSLIDNHDYAAALHFIRTWGDAPGRSRLDTVKRLAAEALPTNVARYGYRLAGHNPAPDWLDRDVLRAADLLAPEVSPPGGRDSSGRRLAAHTRRIAAGGALSALLRHGDRNSMHWSVESRVPFLTTSLAEFAFSLPERLLVSDAGETKHVFRQAMRGIVPDQILDRKDKIGFETPESDWLTHLAPQMPGWLDGLDQVPLLNARASRLLISETVAGSRRYQPQVWRLLNIARFSQMFL